MTHKGQTDENEVDGGEYPVVVTEVIENGIKYRITEIVETGFRLKEMIHDNPPIPEPNLAEQVADQEQRLSDVELVMAELLTGGI